MIEQDQLDLSRVNDQIDRLDWRLDAVEKDLALWRCQVTTTHKILRVGIGLLAIASALLAIAVIYALIQ